MIRNPWPDGPETRALCRLLCRPSPPLVAAARLQCAGDLTALLADLRAPAPALDLVERLQASVDAWRRATGGGLVSYYDPDYPELLRQIARPPLALFLVGSSQCLRAPTVAIVGARAASASARAWTHATAGDLARCGVMVASGLARGIDAAAHQGALDAGGETLAVLGCGPDLCYPPEHAELAGCIAAHGCLVTEFPPGTPPRPWHFPLRNRILSGLAAGVVVVQAEPQSGALVTARQALDENRQVMAVPGEVTDPRSRGPHHLLRQGAALVDGAGDILEALGWLAPQSAARDAGRASSPGAGPAGEAGELLRALGRGLDAESVRARLCWDVPRMQRVLAALELAGLVVRSEDGTLWRARC